MHTYGKMAEEVSECIKNALHTIASTTERSGNMKKELKHNHVRNSKYPEETLLS
jgi:hypothetical protein